jgi:hypothetical protein
VKGIVGRSATRAIGVVAVLLSTRTRGSLTAQSLSVADLPGSTRSAGLGGAGAALVGDAGAVFANPAGIATIRRLALEGSYERYLGGTTFSSAAAALRVGRFDWGVGAQALDYPAAPSYQPTDVLGVTTLVFRRGLAAVGTSLKYARETIGGTPADAWAGDVGVAIAVFDIMAVGASVQNLGGDLGGGAHLPRRTRLGFTMNYVDPQGTLRFLTTIEGQWETGRQTRLVAGAEAGVVTAGMGLMGRVGATAGEGVDGASGSPVAVGAGLELGRLHLDYAYRAFDPPAGGRHRFGARWTP